MDEGVIFGRVKLRNAGFAKVFELDLAEHELAHVVLKRFGTESDLRRKGVHAGRCANQGAGSPFRRRGFGRALTVLETLDDQSLERRLSQ